MSNLLTYLLLAYLVFIVLRWFLVFLGFWRTSLHRIVLEEAEKVPPAAQEVLYRPLSEVTSFGFEQATPLHITSFNGLNNWGCLLVHPTIPAVGLLEVEPLPSPPLPWSLTFFTFFESGLALQTHQYPSNHRYLRLPPNTVSQDPEGVVDIAAQWALHGRKQAELAQREKPCLLPAEAALAVLQRFYQGYEQEQVSAGLLAAEANNGHYFRTVRGALLSTYRQLRHQRLERQLAKEADVWARQSGFAVSEIPTELEVEAYQGWQQRPVRNLRNNGKFWLLTISLVLFIVSFGQLLSWQQVLILTGVIFLHEIGHLVAMRLVGYQNTSFLFLPFLGGLALGEKSRASVVEQMVVLFAGPLPGLLLGFGLAVLLPRIGRVPLAAEVASTLILINLFNLLPFVPLDGGRILDQLVFSLHRYSSLLFTLCAIAAFGVAAIWLREFTLILIPLLLITSLRASYQQARLVNQVRQSLPAFLPDSREGIEVIFAAIKQTGYGESSFYEKAQLVRTLAKETAVPAAGCATRLIFVLFYLFCVAASLIALVVIA